MKLFNNGMTMLSNGMKPLIIGLNSALRLASYGMATDAPDGHTNFWAPNDQYAFESYYSPDNVEFAGNYPGENYPGESHPGESYSGENYTGGNYTGESYPGESYPDAYGYPDTTLHSACSGNEDGSNVDAHCNNDMAINIEGADNIFDLRCSACGKFMDYYEIIKYIQGFVMCSQMNLYSDVGNSQHEFVLKLIEKIIKQQNSVDFFLFSLDYNYQDLLQLMEYCQAHTGRGTSFDAIKHLITIIQGILSNKQGMENPYLHFGSYEDTNFHRNYLFYRTRMTSPLYNNTTDLLIDEMESLAAYDLPIAKDFIYARAIVAMSVWNDRSDNTICTILLNTLHSIKEIGKPSTSYLCRHIVPNIQENLGVFRLKMLNYIFDKRYIAGMAVANEYYVGGICSEYIISPEVCPPMTTIEAIFDEIERMLDPKILGPGFGSHVHKFLIVFSEVFNRYTTAIPSIATLANFLELAFNSRFLTAMKSKLETSIITRISEGTIVDNVFGCEEFKLLNKGRIYGYIFSYSKRYTTVTPSYKFDTFSKVFSHVKNATSRLVICFEMFNSMAITPDDHEDFVKRIRWRILAQNQQSEYEKEHDLQVKNRQFIHYMVGCLMCIINAIEALNVPAGQKIDLPLVLRPYLRVYKDCFSAFKENIIELNSEPLQDSYLTHVFYGLTYYLRDLVAKKISNEDIEMCRMPIEYPVVNAITRMSSGVRFMLATSNSWVKQLIGNAVKSYLSFLLSNEDILTALLKRHKNKDKKTGHDYNKIVLSHTVRPLLLGRIKPGVIYDEYLKKNEAYYQVVLTCHFLQAIFSEFPEKRITGFGQVVTKSELPISTKSSVIKDIKAGLEKDLLKVLTKFNLELQIRLSFCQSKDDIVTLLRNFARAFQDINFSTDFNDVSEDFADKLTHSILLILCRYSVIKGVPIRTETANAQYFEFLQELLPVEKIILPHQYLKRMTTL